MFFSHPDFRREVLHLLEQILSQVKLQGEQMATGLLGLQAAVASLITANAVVVSDVQKLLAGQSAGPGPGQVIVNQSDIDALTASVSALTAADQASDATVNPPAPAPAA